MFLSRALAIVAMSALSAPVLGIRFSSTPSTTMSAQIAATTSGPTPTKVVIAVQDYLSLYSYGISAEASIVGTTEGTETVSGVNYNDPNVIYTLACVAPTPTGASGVCSSASLYTFTQAWARDTFAFEIPIPWYSNGHDRSDPQASADLTAWWMERCGYSGLDQPTTFRRCTGHWTSMNLSVTKSDIFKSTRTNVWFGITDIPVTAGLEKLAAQTEYITTTSTMCNNYFWWGAPGSAYPSPGAPQKGYSCSSTSSSSATTSSTFSSLLSPSVSRTEPQVQDSSKAGMSPKASDNKSHASTHVASSAATVLGFLFTLSLL